MELSLPSPASTNGTWLANQAVHGLVRSMITRQDTWHPRYGVTPGLGNEVLHGLADVLTATATAALELGAMAYARGVLHNWFTFYVRDDGMVASRGVERSGIALRLSVLMAPIAPGCSSGGSSMSSRRKSW